LTAKEDPKRKEVANKQNKISNHQKVSNDNSRKKERNGIQNGFVKM
jgi:hypothetical protein